MTDPTAKQKDGLMMPDKTNAAPRGLMYFQWHITDNCDQRCRHCYIFGEDPGKELYSMPVDRCIEYTAQKNARPLFVITGGDPILNPEFWKLAEYLKEKKLFFYIMGNPFHLTQEVCDRLHECGCIAFQLSIDGLKETHDYLRKQGSYDATWECLARLHKAGISTVVMSTVSELNIKEIPEVMDVAVEHRAGSFTFARYVPTGSKKKNSIEPLEYRRFLDTCYRKYERYREQGCWTEFVEKEHLFTLYKYEEGIVTIPKTAKPGVLYDGCHIGLSECILPDGTLFACRRTAGSEIGNIFDDSFLDGNDPYSKRMMSYRMIDKYEDCSRCRLSQWCRGCHAVSQGQYGDFFKRDPQCWHVVE